MDWEKPIKNIHKCLKTYVVENSIKSLVVGISGGIDSAATVALAQPICSSVGIPLIGRSYPIMSNETEEIERARLVGEAFCTEFKEENLSEDFCNLAVMLDIRHPESVEEKIRAGNVKARLRMMWLYDLAARHKGMVLSTDNYSELLLGFWTLHGDVGDYGMIQQLWKTEVYDMALYMVAVLDDENKKGALLDCVQATPTDGLGITNSDLDQLGAKDYDEVDRILKIWLMDNATVNEFYQSKKLDALNAQTVLGEFRKMREEYAEHPVVLRYERTHFKRKNPYNLSREDILNGPTYNLEK